MKPSEMFEDMDEIRAFADTLRPTMTPEQYESLLYILGLLENTGVSVPVEIDGKTILIDAFIAPIIEEFNRNGRITLACCSGLQEEHQNTISEGSSPYIAFAFDSDLMEKLQQAQSEYGFTVSESEAYLKPCVSVHFKKVPDDEQKRKWLALRDLLRP